MDSRWRFLHPVLAELWGRGREAQAGRGKIRRKRRMRHAANLYAGAGGVKRSEPKSSEVCGPAAEKSRYCPVRARTVDRHRWMRRGS